DGPGRAETARALSRNSPSPAYEAPTRPPGLCSGGRTPATPGGGADRDVRATRAWRNPGIAIDFIEVEHAAVLPATRAGAEPRQRRHSAPRAPAPCRSRNGAGAEPRQCLAVLDD